MDKAAVLAVRITRNHALPDGNKRLAWQALTLFCALNGRELRACVDDAVETMLQIAAGKLDEAAVANWLATRLGPAEKPDAATPFATPMQRNKAEAPVWSGAGKAVTRP